MEAANVLLREAFPAVDGLQNPILQQNMSFSVPIALNLCSFFWLTKTTGWLYLTMGKKWILFASMTQCKIDLTGNAYHLLLDMCNVQILTSQSKS